MTKNKKMSKKAKLLLLKNFLGDEVMLKAMVDTFSDKELNEYIDTNLDTLLINEGRR